MTLARRPGVNGGDDFRADHSCGLLSFRRVGERVNRNKRLSLGGHGSVLVSGGREVEYLPLRGTRFSFRSFALDLPLICN